MNSIAPRIVDQEIKTVRPLRALSAGAGQFDEAWLQELLFRHPELLPVPDIDPSFGKLIPLAREFPVTAGYVDVLYATAEGSLCLVETKLWRNPEAHRTVLAQLLDYAKDISLMNYAEFKARVEAASGRNARSQNLDELIKSASDGKAYNPIDFEANLRRSMASGNFLLLIAGDRIRPEVALLSDILGTAPSLEFSLALVEMNFYHLDPKQDWPVLAVPFVVGRSHEVTRAVVRIRYEEKRPEVEVVASDDAEIAAGKTSPEIFLKSMASGLDNVFRPYLERWMSGPYTVYWGKIGFSLRYAPKDKLVTLFDAYPTYLGIVAEKYVASTHLPPEAYRTYREALAVIPILQRTFSRNSRYVDYNHLTQEEVRQILEATDRLAEAWVNSSSGPRP